MKCMLKYVSQQISGTEKAQWSLIIRAVRGGSRIPGKEVRRYKGMGDRFADFISFFLMKMK